MIIIGLITLITDLITFSVIILNYVSSRLITYDCVYVSLQLRTSFLISLIIYKDKHCRVSSFIILKVRDTSLNITVRHINTMRHYRRKFLIGKAFQAIERYTRCEVTHGE